MSSSAWPVISPTWLSEKQIIEFYNASVSGRLIRGEIVSNSDTVDLAVSSLRTGLRHQAFARWLGERLLAATATADKEGSKFTTPKYRGLLDALIAAEVAGTFHTSSDLIGASDTLIEWAVPEDRTFREVSSLHSLFLVIDGSANVIYRLDDDTSNVLLVSACGLRNSPRLSSAKTLRN